MRAEVSDGPPDGNGVTRMILRSGYPCAKALETRAISVKIGNRIFFKATLPCRSRPYYSDRLDALGPERGGRRRRGEETDQRLGRLRLLGGCAQARGKTDFGLQLLRDRA